MGLEVRVDSTALDVNVTGADRFWGLRSRLELPTGRIVSAKVRPTSEAKADLWMRAAGLGFPRMAAVGYFHGRTAKRQWWRVYRADRVVVIDLDEASRFDRIVLQIDPPDDPDLVVAAIDDARAALADRGRS
ncbi:MAG: hypothetical protein ACE367_10050 [Acidimicrobiales bacterium]